MLNSIRHIIPIVLLAATLASSCNKQYLTGYYSPEEYWKVCSWKKQVDDKYTPKVEYMRQIQALEDSADVTIYLGTYCPDSKKWVPRFFKLLPALPIGDVEIVSVDTTKIDFKGLAPKDGIEKIPTFVFHQEGEEFGRIVEKPKMRLEKRIYLELKKGE